jgi:hypothetical protein
VNVLDQVRQVIDGNAIVADVGCDNIGGQRKQRVFGTFIIGHLCISPLRAEICTIIRLDAAGISRVSEARNPIDL